MHDDLAAGRATSLPRGATSSPAAAPPRSRTPPSPAPGHAWPGRAAPGRGRPAQPAHQVSTAAAPSPPQTASPGTPQHRAPARPADTALTGRCRGWQAPAPRSRARRTPRSRHSPAATAATPGSRRAPANLASSARTDRARGRSRGAITAAPSSASCHDPGTVIAARLRSPLNDSLDTDSLPATPTRGTITTWLKTCPSCAAATRPGRPPRPGRLRRLRQPDPPVHPLRQARLPLPGRPAPAARTLLPAHPQSRRQNRDHPAHR